MKTVTHKGTLFIVLARDWVILTDVTAFLQRPCEHSVYLETDPQLANRKRKQSKSYHGYENDLLVFIVQITFSSSWYLTGTFLNIHYFETPYGLSLTGGSVSVILVQTYKKTCTRNFKMHLSFSMIYCSRKKILQLRTTEFYWGNSVLTFTESQMWCPGDEGGCLWTSRGSKCSLSDPDEGAHQIKQPHQSGLICTH